jgi:predicted lipoprotein
MMRALPLLVLLWPSCRAPIPDENVFTGRTSSGGLGARATGGTSSHPASSGGRGGSVSSAGAGRATGGAGSAEGGADSGGEESGTGGATTVEPTPPFSKEALLTAIARCTSEQVQAFATAANVLSLRLEAHENQPSRETLVAAEAAWSEAMDSLQVLEALRFGPMARANEDPKGLDLRDQMYAWPLGGRCNVETQIVSKGYEAASFASSLINVRGMGTLEYLLFYPGADNACPSYSAMNAQGTWAALGPDELGQRKASFARVVAHDVAAHASSLLAAWQSENGNFEATFASGRAYPTLQAALNAASNALFYAEIEVKDLKLAVPLGLSPDCASATCPETLESHYANFSKRNIGNNLSGFRRLFSGCAATGPAAVGFDDWLDAVGANDLRARMLTALTSAEESLNPPDEVLEQELLVDPARVRRIYDSVKALTDLLKSEFVSVLELELPKTTEGDND